MKKVRTGLIQFSVLIFCLIIMHIFLESHYVAVGECAAISYYKPLAHWDRLLFIVIGITALFISIKIAKPSKYYIILLSVIYTVIIVSYSIFGNQLLGMTIKDWPHEYRPHSIGSDNIAHYTDNDLVGFWERIYCEESSDSVTFLAPAIEFDNDNIFANGDPTYDYTYYVHHDTLTIHRPNNAIQEYKILVVGTNTLIVKLLLHEIFVDGFYEVSDSIIISFRRVDNITVPKKSPFSTNL